MSWSRLAGDDGLPMLVASASIVVTPLNPVTTDGFNALDGSNSKVRTGRLSASGHSEQ